MASLIRGRLTLVAALALTLGVSTTSFAQIIVPGYPYPAYRYEAPDLFVKFDVKPKEAAVYVDGYFAGVVDDYDGAFQRLRTAPGGHEITLFLEGYRTYSERVYLSADNTFKFKHRMEKLAVPSSTSPTIRKEEMLVELRGSRKTVCQMPLVVVYQRHCLPTGCSELFIGSSTRNTRCALRTPLSSTTQSVRSNSKGV